jgi:prepilin peptidase CpaA
MHLSVLFTTFIVAFVLAVAIGDLMWKRIPRQLTTVACGIGLVYHAFFGDFLSALLAAATGFAIGVIFFRMGAIGGGDVKLLAALGALLGFARWEKAMFVAVLVAAVVGLIVAMSERALKRTLRNSFALLASLPSRGLAPHEAIHLQSGMAVRAPFGIAAAAGTIFALVMS